MSTSQDTGIITGSEFAPSDTTYAKPKMNPSGERM